MAGLAWNGGPTWVEYASASAAVPSFPRGFLPAADPAARFSGARARPLHPALARGGRHPADLPELCLFYVRVGFLASAHINQVGEPPILVLPANIAFPLSKACPLLDRPPILSYDGYALYNWKRFDPAGPIALGDIDNLQNFGHLYDEHWFILVHVEIEAIAAEILGAVRGAFREHANENAGGLKQHLLDIGNALRSGMGGTPYMKWLRQLIEETLVHMPGVREEETKSPGRSSRPGPDFSARRCQSRLRTSGRTGVRTCAAGWA